VGGELGSDDAVLAGERIRGKVHMGDTFWWAAMIALFVVAGLALFAF
jgi:hypothetical protein